MVINWEREIKKFEQDIIVAGRKHRYGTEGWRIVEQYVRIRSWVAIGIMITATAILYQVAVLLIRAPISERVADCVAMAIFSLIVEVCFWRWIRAILREGGMGFRDLFPRIRSGRKMGSDAKLVLAILATISLAVTAIALIYQGWIAIEVKRFYGLVLAATVIAVGLVMFSDSGIWRTAEDQNDPGA